MTEIERALDLLRRHHGQGLLVDTNLLLLWLVGNVDRDLISRHKRTDTYDEDAFLLLGGLIRRAKHLVITPHVATEVSNLGRQGGKDRQISDFFKRFLTDTKERSPALRALAGNGAYDRLGVTDAGIAHFGRWRAPLVLTDDLDLSIQLEQQGRAVINFSRIRGLFL